MTQGFTLSSSLNYLCFDFKFCCLTQSSAEIMTVWSSQLPGDSWSLLAGKCSTQNSYAEQISIFLHQMLVSRCHRLVKSLETPQEKICEYMCRRPGDKNNLEVLWEGTYSLIRWCFAIPVQGTQSGGCYTGTSTAVNSWFICSFCSSFQPRLLLAELTDPIPCPEQWVSPMGRSLVIPSFGHPIVSVGHWAGSSSEAAGLGSSSSHWRKRDTGGVTKPQEGTVSRHGTAEPQVTPALCSLGLQSSEGAVQGWFPGHSPCCRGGSQALPKAPLQSFFIF